MELQQAIEEITEKIDCITGEDFGEGYFITQQVRDRYYYRKGEAVGLRKALDKMEKVELPEEEPLVVLPKVIATLLDRCKANGYCLASSMRLRKGDPIFLNEQEQMEYHSWIRFRSYQERFAMAWVKGFELAKGKRWIVNYDGVFLAKPVETDGENGNAEAPEETGASSVSLPTVDFESLLAQGPDVKAWLELPGTVIQYPVAQGEDNSYYLKHLYDGTANKVGCLFIDYENAEDFSDNNTIIYGHNMRDGSMFSTLVEYKAQAYYDEHPEMYLVTPEGGYVVEVFSAFVASPEESGSETSPWALEWKDSGAYTTWLSAMQERSVIETGVSVTSSDKVLTLSTCTNGGADRFIVMGRLVAVTE